MDQKNGFILIGTVTVILIIFLLAFFLIMLIYRKRKIEHRKEMEIINQAHKEAILSTQLEIQQQTMQDLGREIHDNISQKLTLASIYAQQFVYENKYPGANEKIDIICSVINTALLELQSLSRSLTSNYIQQTTLTQLIKTECERIILSGRCKVVYELSKATIPIDDTKKKVALRIVQEFLQNSLKHAKCRIIHLAVLYDGNCLQIVGNDDGVGFDVGATTKKTAGIGLENMRKRAEMIGARFSIASTLNKGTEINFTLALP
ncbi:two-component sensor histidine kinase [Panacibacter sp. DH6]|uniref:histidine kinase n=1 Tax=Panacibacter microcysteis TaxID=2793269 RepID=A0A931GWI6_9BACT|nr:ATP-binding protein [Panacibacter microcysteis]MBG9376393.1 two-component sensor histidine kinase [Panacibacter microcysteis]